MLWEEKIDWLTKEFSPAEFKVPFTDWVEIMKNIERAFILKQNTNQNFNNCSENIKRRTQVRAITFSELGKLSGLLSNDQNYWVVLVFGETSNSKHYVYDCRPKAIWPLISLVQFDFYIIEKKYGWLTYFKRNTYNERISVYKSNGTKTPFDIKPIAEI